MLRSPGDDKCVPQRSLRFRLTCPAAIISLSPFQIKLTKGKSCVLILTTAFGGCSGPFGYTTVILLSCAVNASASPLGEKAHPWIHPAELLRYSPQTVLKGSLSPQTLLSGLASTPLMKLEKTLACASVEPAASSTEFGCHATVVIVLRIGFLMCLDTHQSFSSSK